MKRFVTTVAVLGCLAGMPGGARAHDAYNDSYSHPLLLTSYLLAPAGFAVEWLVTRPIHFLVSHPQLEPVFNFRPQEDPFGTYQVYDPDYGPAAE